jgi:6-phosphogluconolactonase
MTSTKNWIAYIGTYTTGVSKGIYAYRYQPETGGLEPIGLAAETLSPSFLATHPNGRVLYAVNEAQSYNGMANSGAVSAFTIDPASARLTLLNTVATHGADPCHLVVDHSGRWLFVANYTGGSLAVFPIGESGSLGEASQVIQHTGAARVDPQRQEAAHVHSVNLSDDNRFLYVSDLGLDTIFVYSLDAATGKLKEHATTRSAPGAGPRHIAFTPDRRFAYSFAELNSMITFYGHKAATAELQEIQSVSSLPAGYTGPRSGAEIAVDPTGRFLYASNRGHNSIATFNIDPEQGLLRLVGHVSTLGRTPRHFTIDPTGTYLFAANQDGSSIVTYRIDPNTGVLTSVGDPIVVGDPVCILFVKLA